MTGRNSKFRITSSPYSQPSCAAMPSHVSDRSTHWQPRPETHNLNIWYSRRNICWKHVALCVWSLQRRCKNKKASGRNLTEFNSYSIRIFFQNWKWEHLEQRTSDQRTWIQQHECLNSVVDPSQFKDNLEKHSQTGSSKWNINPPCGTDRASYTVIYRQTASSKSGRLPGSQE